MDARRLRQRWRIRWVYGSTHPPTSTSPTLATCAFEKSRHQRVAFPRLLAMGLPASPATAQPPLAPSSTAQEVSQEVPRETSGSPPLATPESARCRFRRAIAIRSWEEAAFHRAVVKQTSTATVAQLLAPGWNCPLTLEWIRRQMLVSWTTAG